jgi:hypothetical protein
MRPVVLALLLSVGGACVRAPEIVMVDRATALELQASGSFEALERELDRAAIEPRPVPLTPEQLEALGIRPAPLVDESELTEADRVDRLLLSHCLGEGKDGLIADTREACEGAADFEELVVLLERVNRARLALWRWMHEAHSGSSEPELRRRWREIHLQNVACGAWVEGDDGAWQAKSC